MYPAFTIETSKIVGTPFDGYWSQVHTYFPSDKEKKEKRGDLLAVLVISGVEEGIGAVAVGREILGRLHEEYYGNLEGSAFERLKEAVKRISLEKEGLEIIAASLFGKALYLAICGYGKVILKRGDKLGIVLSGEGEGVQTASGILQSEDFMVLGSSHFFQSIGYGVLKAALDNNSLQETTENLAPIILGRKNMADTAAIFALTKEVVREDQDFLVEAPQFSVEKTNNSCLLRKEETSLLKKIVSKINFSKRKPLFVRREETEKKKKFLFILSLIFLGLLSISLVFGFQKSRVEQGRKKIKSMISASEEKFNKGKEIYSTKPEEGKNLVKEARKIIEEALFLKKDDQELILLGEQMDKFLSGTGVEVSLPELPVFMDLGLIVDGASGISFAQNGNNLVILDKNKKKIYLLDVDKKSHEEIDYPSEKGKIIIGGEKIYVLDEEAIFEVSFSGKKIIPRIEKQKDWEETVGFSSFNKNLYVLDKKSNSLWRYLASEDGFVQKSNWFLNASPNLSNAVSMAIDGSIWLLEKDKISKFTLGNPDNFTLSKMPASQRGEPEVFIDPTKIFTTGDGQNLYVLDKGRGKVYVIDKAGEFKASYRGEVIKQANDLVVIESIKKIFLLSGAKIYEIGMK